jgi:Flp pilus assembly protein TadD
MLARAHPFRCLTVALALTAVLPYLAHAADTETTPVTNAEDVHYEAGKAAVDKKQWKEAVRHFTAAVKANPKSADSHNMLGYSQRWLGNYDQAFVSYAQALKLDPKHRGALEYRGVAYVKVGKLDLAKADLAALERVCGVTCEEYKDLAKAISTP